MCIRDSSSTASSANVPGLLSRTLRSSGTSRGMGLAVFNTLKDSGFLNEADLPPNVSPRAEFVHTRGSVQAVFIRGAGPRKTAV
eukprot:3888991-Alexandrium_andersonii.AAC.1